MTTVYECPLAKWLDLLAAVKAAKEDADHLARITEETLADPTIDQDIKDGTMKVWGQKLEVWMDAEDALEAFYNR